MDNLMLKRKLSLFITNHEYFRQEGQPVPPQIATTGNLMLRIILVLGLLLFCIWFYLHASMKFKKSTA
jgi:hypothetical protein